MKSLWHVGGVWAGRSADEDDGWASAQAGQGEYGGADGITVHLREDRRHIQDDDVRRLKECTQIKLNLEMAATDEMVAIAVGLRPQLSMFVPEKRQEVTTEGGLDVIGDYLTEVNVTSPTGVQEINALDGVKLEANMLDWIERHAPGR